MQINLRHKHILKMLAWTKAVSDGSDNQSKLEGTHYYLHSNCTDLWSKSFHTSEWLSQRLSKVVG